MNVLALDLGTKTGWALNRVGLMSPTLWSSGTWLLANEKELRQQRKEDRDRCCDMRFGRLVSHIKSCVPLDYIYFEDVQFLSSQLQSQLWAGFRTVVTLFEREIPNLVIRAVPVGTLKKFATGKGNAKKEDMARSLFEKIGVSPFGRDDNEVDALHLLNFAMKDIWKPK